MFACANCHRSFGLVFVPLLILKFYFLNIILNLLIYHHVLFLLKIHGIAKPVGVCQADLRSVSSLHGLIWPGGSLRRRVCDCAPT